MYFNLIESIAPLNLDHKEITLCTYIGSNNPLRPLHVSAYLTFTWLKNSDALIRKHIEHIPHTQPWKRWQNQSVDIHSFKKQQIQIRKQPLLPSYRTFVIDISISLLEETQLDSCSHVIVLTWLGSVWLPAILTMPTKGPVSNMSTTSN